MGIRDIINKKKEEFYSRKTQSVAENIVELKKERVREEGRANIYRLEKREKDKLLKARSERKSLQREKTLAPLKKVQEGLAYIKKQGKKIKVDDKNNPWR